MYIDNCKIYLKVTHTSFLVVAAIVPEAKTLFQRCNGSSRFRRRDSGRHAVPFADLSKVLESFKGIRAEQACGRGLFLVHRGRCLYAPPLCSRLPGTVILDILVLCFLLLIVLKLSYLF